jgi:hypothetical protein
MTCRWIRVRIIHRMMKSLVIILGYFLLILCLAKVPFWRDKIRRGLLDKTFTRRLAKDRIIVSSFLLLRIICTLTLRLLLHLVLLAKYTTNNERLIILPLFIHLLRGICSNNSLWKQPPVYTLMLLKKTLCIKVP